jgi:hypothetical protein
MINDGATMRIPELNPNAITAISYSTKQNKNGSAATYAENLAGTGSTSPSVKYTAFDSKLDTGSDYLTGMVHRSSLLNLADERLTTLNKQLSKVEKSIQKERPDIAKKAWDFGIKDGKVIITGDDLTAKDTEWLEAKINANNSLATAASNYISLASSYLETSKINPSYISVNNLTSSELTYNFHDTKKSLESVGFRSFAKALHTAYDTGHGEVTSGYGSAYISFDYLAATILTPTPTASTAS